MTEVIQIVTTTATSDDARRIGRALVERRLAACVQIVGPIESIYRWQGKIETAVEFQCWIKTRGALYGRVEQTIRELHPYDVPEVLAVPVAGVAELVFSRTNTTPYLEWLKAETDVD
jgi:periplasmic divalent cation tolerance protein